MPPCLRSLWDVRDNPSRKKKLNKHHLILILNTVQRRYEESSGSAAAWNSPLRSLAKLTTGKIAHLDSPSLSLLSHGWKLQWGGQPARRKDTNPILFLLQEAGW